MEDASTPPLRQYEAAMRDAADLLRRRDLASYEETPLYFAWERLYATRNKSLSVDFLQETPAERAERKQARLAPRQGLPPPRTSRKAEAWTTFDAPLRKSLQASSFLRPSEVLSPAAVDAIAWKYRRQAAKHRAARGGSLDDSLVPDDAGQPRSSRNRSKKSRKQRMNQQVQRDKQTLELSDVSDQDDEDNEDFRAGGRSGHDEGVETAEDALGDSFARVEGVAKVAPISGTLSPALGQAASTAEVKYATPGTAWAASSSVAVNYARTPDPAIDAKFQDNTESKLSSKVQTEGPAPANENVATTALLSKLFQYVHADQDPETVYRVGENTSSGQTTSQPPKTVVRRATGAESVESADAGRRVSRRHDGSAQADDTIDEGDEWEEDDAELSPASVPVEDRDRRRSAGFRVSSMAMDSSRRRRNRASSRDLECFEMPRHYESGGSSGEDNAQPPRVSRHANHAGLEEILWPPGMRATATKVRVPRFDAVRPVGLEAVKTEEEWRDYWVWLHWYSSWQVWYLNNDISHSKSRRKDRRGGDQKPASKAAAYRHPSTVSK